MSDLEDLKAVRELLSDPARWTKHVSARDKDGHNTHVRSKTAACFRLSGAVHKVRNNLPARERLLDKISLHIPAGECHIPDYNDETYTTHADVLALVDRAIETEMKL